MMSQPFQSNFRNPLSTRPDDFMMMNNNYLPGIARMNCNLPFNRISAPNGLVINQQTPQSLLPNHASSMQQPNFVAQNTFSSSTATNVAELSDSAGSADGDTLMSDDLCENNATLSEPRGLNAISAGSHSWPTMCSIPQVVASSAGFTFTTPTQSYLYSPSLTATTQNRFQYTRATPHNFAPGCNAQWQHAVPRQISWRSQGMVTTPQGVSVFTGTQSASVCSMTSSVNMLGTYTFNSPYVYHPVASCSEVMRRPKRRHTVDVMDDSGPHKVHLTEEKIANHMRDLNLNQYSPPDKSDIKGSKSLQSLSSMCSNFVDLGTDYQIHGKRKLHTNEQIVGSDNDKERPSKCQCCRMNQSSECQNQSKMCENLKSESQSATDQSQSTDSTSELLRHSQRQWHDFKLLEEKLEMIDEDSDNEETSSDQPKLTIREGINITPAALIPDDIMNKIRNPCRDVILWSPPDPAVKTPVDVADVSCHGNTTDTQPCMDMMEETINSSPQQICPDKLVTDDTGMETEYVEDMLDL